MTGTVLFLCTGNYYRSRFAELLFNSLACSSGLPWTSISRGIATEVGVRNMGPISPIALERLKEREVEVDQNIRGPMQLIAGDLYRADLIVALNEREHRPYLQTRFPQWEERVEYWHISDLDITPAGEALSEMEQEVQRLIQRLGASRLNGAGHTY